MKKRKKTKKNYKKQKKREREGEEEREREVGVNLVIEQVGPEKVCVREGGINSSLPVIVYRVCPISGIYRIVNCFMIGEASLLIMI